MPRIVGAVQAAAKILAVLEEKHGVPCTLSEIAREAGLYKGTCNDLLYTLELLGYVIRVPEQRGYRLGPALARLGALALPESNYLQIARRYLPLLGATVNTTCHLLQRYGADQMQVVARVEGPPDYLTIGGLVGQCFPLTLSRGAGRVFLAWMTMAEQRAIFDQCRYEGCRSEYRHDWEAFQADLEQVRKQGYALARGIHPGLGQDVAAFLAAPIFGPDGRLVLVADVTPLGAPAAEEHIPRYLEALLDITRRITQAIGGKFPTTDPLPEVITHAATP